VRKSKRHFLSDTLGASYIVIAVVLLILAVALVVLSLIYLVKTMRSLVINTMEKVSDTYIFRNTFTAFLLGMLLTAVV
jgi:uncharacterized BrkB/YihY/UPF0761 family membrane protein